MTEITKQLLTRVAEHVKELFQENDPSHDWEHVRRVVALSRLLADQEGQDDELVTLLALLHDVGDKKYLKPGETTEVGLLQICDRFDIQGVLREIVIRDIPRISYSYEVATEQKPETIAGKIVQDADRLDALGVIGLFRAVGFGTARGRPFYTVGSEYTVKARKAGQKLSEQKSTVDHMHVKLPDLPRRMNTKAAKELAKIKMAIVDENLLALEEEQKLLKGFLPDF